jgi:hypothetical protein
VASTNSLLLGEGHLSRLMHVTHAVCFVLYMLFT